MGWQRSAAGASTTALFTGAPAHRLALLRALWAQAVGADVARGTEILALDGETLRVRVRDAGWRKVLHRMRGDILARLRTLAGPAAPRQLGFVEGPIAVAPRELPRAPEPRAPAPPVPAAVADAAAAIQDDDLRARFLGTAARYLARTAASPRR